MSNQPCKYCGIEITRWEKLPDGKYLRYDKNGLHKYDICKAEQLKRHKTSYQPNNQVQVGQPSTSKSQISNYIANSSTFPVDKEPEIRGVTINSLFIQTSNLVKEQKETNKRLETLQSIADAIAQQVTLLIAKVGYPKPEPVVPNPKKTDESGVLLKDGQEVKAVQRHPTSEELANAFAFKIPSPTQDVTTNAMQFLNKTNDVMQWENLSEAFVCHNCEGKFHNGFMKLGTRLCPNCKDNIESNEIEDSKDKDRSDINDFNPKPRTIEEINNDERYDF